MPSALLSLDAAVVIAHRGGSGLRPENTIAAFEHAVALGVDGLECDVHLSRDGQPVVIHDATLDRTTDATGPVAALTAPELARVDAGCRFVDADGRTPFAGCGIGVPTLASVLERFRDMPVTVEIKGEDPAVVPAVLDVIVRHGGRGRVVVGGFSAAVLQAVRALAPDLATSASVPEVKRALRRAWFGLTPRSDGYRLFQVPIRYEGRQVLTRRFAAAARRAGLPVHAWVVDDPGEMEMLLGWGVTGLITDRPDIARQVLAARGAGGSGAKFRET